jgi:hypothetical protein
MNDTPTPRTDEYQRDAYSSHQNSHHVCNAFEFARKLECELARANQLFLDSLDPSHAGSLLAIIHRDGGHYLTKHGWQKAALDAAEIVYEMRREDEGLESKLNIANLSTEFAANEVQIRNEQLAKLEIRHDAMMELMKEKCFQTFGRAEFNRHGFSFMVDEETALRDINYRNAPLWATAEEAVEAAIKFYSQP